MKTPDKINGRTPDEIYKALRCLIVQMNDGCDDYYSCECCQHNINGGRLGLAARLDDALAYIQQLERERDAAVGDLQLAVCDDLKCSTCFHKGNESHACDDCDVVTFSNWQWRGVQEVNGNAE